MKNKGRKGRGGASGPQSVARLEEGVGSMSLSSSVHANAISLFPARPARKPNEKAPGTTVRLLTNLFRLHVTQNKPIFKCTVNVALEESSNDEAPTGGATPAKDRKLSKEIRCQAVSAAIGEWVRDHRPPDYNQRLEFNYVFDSNGSIVYSLFDMFAKRPNEKDQEIAVKIKVERIVDQKLAKVDQCFRVKLFRQEQLNMRRLVDFCLSAKGMTSDITTIQEELRAVNVILRGKMCTIATNVLTPLNVFPYKRENQFKVSEGVLINKGYSLSARPTEGGMTLNIANTVAFFHEEIDLVGLLQSRFSVRDLSKPLQPYVIENLLREIRNKQVEARHINYGTKQRPHYRRYRVSDVSGSSKDKFFLINKETKVKVEISIEDYFKNNYPDCKLRYPNLPCIVDRGRKIPLEVCHLIEKQRITRKMDPRETSEVIKKAALPPKEHFAQVQQHVAEVTKMKSPLTDFGLDFKPENIQVDGRELVPIAMLGGTRNDIRPSNGEYNVQRDRFVKPAILNRWIMTFIVDRTVDYDLKNKGNLAEDIFARLYCDSARSKGVQAPPSSGCAKIYPEANDMKSKAALKSHFERLNKNKIDFSIFVLPDTCPDWVYRYLQYLEVSVRADRGPKENSTRIACLKYSNYTKKIINGRDQGRMFLSNLWLKHNTKLGGVNFVLKYSPTLRFLQDGYLFISVDVCHPAPGDKLPQSVAAVVGMWDLHNPGMSYCTRLRVQKKERSDHSTVEDVGEIGVMVEEVLESYKAKKTKFPSNIVILRDGVSEGQFRIVLEGELRRVKAALAKKYSSAQAKLPQVSCLVVQKRHKVRFIRVQPHKGYRGDDFNIQPGTVVDSDIVHPHDFSFYLAPHKAIKGTSRAPHIYIILDEIGFSQDEAQSMIHSLSYLSPRCTKSTSIPTPVNLADLAAERGKNIVISWNDDNGGKMSDDERLKRLNQFLSTMADINHKNTLFYV